MTISTTANISTLIENLQEIMDKFGDLPVVVAHDADCNTFLTFDESGENKYVRKNGILILVPSESDCELNDLVDYDYNDRKYANSYEAVEEDEDEDDLYGYGYEDEEDY